MMRATTREKKLMPWILAAALALTHLAFLARDRWEDQQLRGQQEVELHLPAPVVPGL